jgi:sigma-B regulation protein RsbU (phosphoserine phosphatase)
MEDELNVGREIQMSMLPLIFPPYPRRNDFDVHAALVPAREVGGDFYDFFLIDEDRFCFCIGDVSGKGVPAALFMAVTKTLIESRARNDSSPASILTHVNNEISRHNEACMFVTLVLGILDLRTGELSFSNAGHAFGWQSRQPGRAPRPRDRGRRRRRVRGGPS